MTAPWFAAFGESSFYIIIEGIILCETSTFVKGLCLWFASHYVFNLEYSKSLKEVCLSSRICVQASSRNKKTARYLMTSSNIMKYVCDWLTDFTICTLMLLLLCLKIICLICICLICMVVTVWCNIIIYYAVWFK